MCSTLHTTGIVVLKYRVLSPGHQRKVWVDLRFGLIIGSYYYFIIIIYSFCFFSLHLNPTDLLFSTSSIFGTKNTNMTSRYSSSSLPCVRRKISGVFKKKADCHHFFFKHHFIHSHGFSVFGRQEAYCMIRKPTVSTELNKNDCIIRLYFEGWKSDIHDVHFQSGLWCEQMCFIQWKGHMV